MHARCGSHKLGRPGSSANAATTNSALFFSPGVEMRDFGSGGSGEPGVEMVGDFAATSKYRRTVLRSSLSSRAMRRRDQPCADNCCIVFCSCTLRTFAIVPAVMPSREHSAEIYWRLKVGNLESVKRDHFRPEVVPF